MRNSLFVAVVLCLLTPSVWAGKWTSFAFLAYIDGVDRHGNLDESLGTDTTFNAIINTKTGHYSGTARGSVTNLSGSGHLYYNKAIGSISNGDVVINASLYRVGLGGRAVLVATGNLYNSL
jgi:hypothetical protein